MQLFSQRWHASWILAVYTVFSSIYKCTTHTHSYSRSRVRRFPDLLSWNSPISRSSPRSSHSTRETFCVFYFWSGSCMSRSLSCFSSRSKTVGSTSNSATPRCSSQSSTLAIPGCSSRHSLQRRSKYIQQIHPIDRKNGGLPYGENGECRCLSWKTWGTSFWTCGGNYKELESVCVCVLCFILDEPEKVESCGALIVPAISEPAAQLLRILHREEVLQHVPRDGLVLEVHPPVHTRSRRREL